MRYFPRMLYTFEAFEIDTDELELRRSGARVNVEPQVFALLELLVANTHRVVTKAEINERVWGGRIVSEAAVASRVSSARRALGDDGRQQRLIRTVRDRGFRFTGEVSIAGRVPTTAALVTAPDARPGGEDRTSATQPAPASIAVLPLQPLTDDPLRAPLADAISHEVITELSRLRWLHVIARGSSFRFRNHDVDLAEVGRILGVRYVVSGSFATFERQCVVTVELARADDGSVLWAERIQSPLDELMSLRVTISSQIATRIEGHIQDAEALRADRVDTEDLDSWSAYFRGLWHVYRFNAHDNEVAAHLFRRATVLDPRFARAHAGLSFAHFQNAFLGLRPDRAEQLRLARAHADRGYQIDPSDPFINLTMGRAEMVSGNWAGAAPWFDRATEINGNYSLAFYHRALSDAVMGDGSEGPDLAMRALSLSPLDPMRYAMLSSRGLSHMNRGEYEEASRWADQGARVPNAHVLIWTIAAVAHHLAGHDAQADEWTSRILERDRRLSQRRVFSAFPFASDAFRATFAGALSSLGF